MCCIAKTCIQEPSIVTHRSLETKLYSQLNLRNQVSGICDHPGIGITLSTKEERIVNSCFCAVPLDNSTSQQKSDQRPMFFWLYLFISPPTATLLKLRNSPIVNSLDYFGACIQRCTRWQKF